MGMEKVLTSVTSSCLSDTDTQTSRTPSVVGVTFTVWRYTPPLRRRRYRTALRPRRRSSSPPLTLMVRARRHLRNHGQADSSGWPTLGRCARSNLSVTGACDALHCGFHHAHGLFSDGGAASVPVPGIGSCGERPRVWILSPCCRHSRPLPAQSTGTQAPFSNFSPVMFLSLPKRKRSQLARHNSSGGSVPRSADPRGCGSVPQ